MLPTVSYILNITKEPSQYKINNIVQCIVRSDVSLLCHIHKESFIYHTLVVITYERTLRRAFWIRAIWFQVNFTIYIHVYEKLYSFGSIIISFESTFSFYAMSF